MIESFSVFTPSAWFDEAGMSKIGHAQSEIKPKREPRWKHFARTATLSVLSAAALAVASLVIAKSTTISNEFLIEPPPGIAPLSRAPGPNATLGEINQSFGELFAAFEGSVNLITNERTLQLARAAAASRGARPEDWARKIASDVKDAND